MDQARVDRVERFTRPKTFPDPTMSMVVGVLARAAEGDIADLVELCEHILDTDGFMQSPARGEPSRTGTSRAADQAAGRQGWSVPDVAGLNYGLSLAKCQQMEQDGYDRTIKAITAARAAGRLDAKVEVTA